MAEPPVYRVLVTGSRDWWDYEAVCFELAGLALLHNPLVVVHGAHRTGADCFAAMSAKAIGARQEPHPADWKRWNRKAGPIRNEEMVAAGADLCLCFLMPCSSQRCRNRKPHNSHGATHCADLAEKAGIPTRRITDG